MAAGPRRAEAAEPVSMAFESANVVSGFINSPQRSLPDTDFPVSVDVKSGGEAPQPKRFALSRRLVPQQICRMSASQPTLRLTRMRNAGRRTGTERQPGHECRCRSTLAFGLERTGIKSEALLP